ncbi:MAG: GIY-YIG nuclease family protein, partial [Cyanobacteria bacterium J06558_2]
MPEPFTIKIFVPNGDPKGVRIIDRMNWTGVGIAFPRSEWEKIKQRPEFEKTGVYILVGYQETDDDLQTLYIGQGDGIKNRINSHFQDKEFWDWGIGFVSNSNGLNRAHITWLEYALIKQAKKAARCHLDNTKFPQEPALSEPEKADVRKFLKEIYQILPLLGLQVFEIPKPVAEPKATDLTLANSANEAIKDTVIVPAQREGFERVFLGENCWHAIRIGGGMLDQIKYIAAYQTAPISAITHVAPVDKIEPYGDG